MKNTKNKRVIYNIISNTASRLIAIAMGLIIPRLFLTSFGSEVNGIVSAVKQIFSYLVLLEAGVGLAASQALYKPVAEDDRDKINGILSASRIFYNKTGAIYVAAALGIAGVYSAAVKTEVGSLTVFIIILIYAVPSVLNFLIKQKYALLLSAEGKDYVLTNLAVVLELAVDFGKVGLLLISDNLILIQATYCIAPVVQSAFILFYVKRNYKWLDLRAKPDFRAISQKSAVLVHQISGAVFGNVDIILLSVICDFKVVSVYTVYMMFFKQIEQLIGMITNGITFRLGQMFQVERERFIRFHDLYETCYMTFIFAGYTLTAMFLLPVVELYTADIGDADYVKGGLVILFVIMNLIANGKLPSNQVIEFAGAFGETKSHAIIEMAINLAVSVFGIMRWGIYGGLIGTITALIFRGNAMILYANRRILKRPAAPTYRRWLSNLAVFLAFLIIFGTGSFRGLGWGPLIAHAVLYGFGILAVYMAVNMALDRKVFLWIYNCVKDRRENGCS